MPIIKAIQRAGDYATRLGTRQRNGVGLLLGLLSAAAFAPLGLWPLMFPAITWLVWCLDVAPAPRAAFWSGWWIGFGQLCGGLYWIMLAWQFQSNMPVLFAVPIVLGLCAYLALYAGLAVAVAARFWHSGASRLALLAGLWAIGEFLRGQLLTGFPWNELGSLWVVHALPLAQWAGLVGQLGLSSWTVLLCGAPALLAKHRMWAMGSLGLGAVLALLGGVWMSTHPTRLNAAMQVHVVQANIGQDVKWTLDAPAQMFSAYLWLSHQAVTQRGPGIVIWPETAIPSLLVDDGRGGISVQSILDQPSARYRISRRVLADGGYLITGIDRFEFDAAGHPVTARNALAVFDADGEMIADYDKAHLVPLGEYLPLRSLLEPLGLNRLVPGIIDFTPGPGPRTLALGTAPPVAPLICYEMIFAGDIVARKQRPAWLLNISNDAWFGRSSGPYQHLAQGQMRAIEYGLPMVRSTPTGISAVIDPQGRVLASVPLDRVAVLSHSLPKAGAETAFSRGRQLIPLAMAGLMLFAGRRRKQP